MQDEHENTTAIAQEDLDELALEVMTQQPGGDMAIVPDLAVVADMVIGHEVRHDKKAMPCIYMTWVCKAKSKPA